MTIPLIALIGYLIGAAAPLSAAAIFALRERRTSTTLTADVNRLVEIARLENTLPGEISVEKSAATFSASAADEQANDFTPAEFKSKVRASVATKEAELMKLAAEKQLIFERHGLPAPTYGNVSTLPVLVLSALARRSASRHVWEFIVLGVGIVAALIAGVVTIPFTG